VLLRCQLQPDLAGDRRDDVVLEREHVAQVALVPLAPQLRVGFGVHELRGDPHPVPRAHHRTRNECVHAQLLRDLARREVGLAEAQHRATGDDTLQAAELGEIGDQRFVQPGGQVILAGVAGEVGERQHRQ
jgi:hypothetical protein